MTETTNNWPRAVLFDFDGVIVNSEPIHCAATRAVMATRGMPLSEDTYYHELIGFDDRGGFGHLYKLSGMQFTDDIARELISAKNTIVLKMIREQGITALPGSAELICRLAASKQLAICSGALRSEIEAMLDVIGLRAHFPVIVAGGEVAVGKPDPSGYLRTVELLNERFHLSLSPADCLVVEDSPTVSAAAKNIGFPILGVTTSHGGEKWGVVDFLVPSLLRDSLARAGLPL